MDSHAAVSVGKCSGGFAWDSTQCSSGQSDKPHCNSSNWDSYFWPNAIEHLSDSRIYHFGDYFTVCKFKIERIKKGYSSSCDLSGAGECVFFQSPGTAN